MIRITSEHLLSPLEEPDLFSWANLTLENTSCIEIKILPKDDFCTKEKSSKLILIEDHANFKDANLYCKAHQGELFIPKDYSQLDLYGKLLEASIPCRCSEDIGCAFVGGQKLSAKKVYER